MRTFLMLKGLWSSGALFLCNIPKITIKKYTGFNNVIVIFFIRW